jgi:Ser/Thr protein kinase RdoA (MazF antagonist)
VAKAIEELRARGYQPGEGNFKIGRPDQKSIPLVSRDGLPVVAKFYSGEKGAKAFANMQALWQSKFGERRQPPGLPRPVEYLPELGVLVMERLAGRPLAELTGRNEAIFDDAVRLLAALHQCDAVSETQHGSRDIVRSAQRKADAIAQLTPQYADVVRAAVAGLEACRRKEREMVPSHGDFSPRNVLVGEGRLALIDLDRFQMSDPCRDLAYLGTWNWPEALRRGRWPDRSALERAMQVYKAERPAAFIKKSMGFYVAAGLIRRAHSLVTLWPNEAWLVPALAQAALREMER